LLQKKKDYSIFVGELNGSPVFLLEHYYPKDDLLGSYYHAEEGDQGLHIIVAPANRSRIPDFTWHLFISIMDFVFTHFKAKRIVVEPDIRNKKMFAICQRVGFQLSKVIELPHKTAQLAFLTHNQFRKIQSMNTVIKRGSLNLKDHVVSPQQSVHHLKQDSWNVANRNLIRKALTEFSHERLLNPQRIALGKNSMEVYSIKSDSQEIEYRFSAREMHLNHLCIEKESIEKTTDGKSSPLDAVLFIKEFRKQIGLNDKQLPTYLEEIISTLHSSLYKLSKNNLSSAELIHSDFQSIEQAMTEGHPCFVANNGRIGFDSSDYVAYAPEAGNTFSLIWLAGHKSRTKYSGIDSLDYTKLIDLELSQEHIKKFNNLLIEKGYEPNDYLFIPIHPWQWFNKVAHVFAPDIANGNLVCLGFGEDQYLAQQSVRTLYNVSNPHKHYTKSALSILNMGFMRGLPYYYLGTAPKMATWLEGCLYKDLFIHQSGFKMLSEVASVSYINPYFEEFGVHNDYNKMLASLWRESPQTQGKEDQLMTMAAFLHKDDQGKSFVAELIRASGTNPKEWLQAYFNAYLMPLVHCFYKYDLVFMPHGENIIVKLKNFIPQHIFLKDITEEACILNKHATVPDYLSRMVVDVPEDMKLLSIFIDVFDDFFRFMVEDLVVAEVCSESRFLERFG
jgi:siderophore synthetase component